MVCAWSQSTSVICRPTRCVRDASRKRSRCAPSWPIRSPHKRNRPMTRAPVLFRVDAGLRPGYEHLSRCLVLAAALQRRRRPAYFLSRLAPGSLGLTIKRGGNEWLDADSTIGTPEDIEETLQEIRRLHPAAVIVDSPDVT